MNIEINGKNLTIDNLVKVARAKAKVVLSKDSIVKIKDCRLLVEEKIEANEIMYGINTGIGEFSETILKPDQMKDFQKYLIYNHAAGIGDPCPLDHVRAAMVSRINVHAKGMSGCRLVITETLVEMLNKDVIPYVCSKGSVGASGDLAPMSQIALVLLGEGKAYYKKELLNAKEAMNKAGILNYKNFAIDLLSKVNNKPISFEVFADEIDEMEKQANEISSWGANVNIKIPITNTLGESTAPLVKKLTKNNITCNVTAIFTITQLLSIIETIDENANIILSLFAGRIADTGVNPVPIIEESVNLTKHMPNCKILWASPREFLNIFQAQL